MVMVVNQVKMEDEDILAVEVWLTKTPTERIAEVTALRNKYFSWKDKFFPSKIEKVVTKKPL